MLVQYAVENYKSIKDEVVINFTADEKYRASDWVINKKYLSKPLYKCIGLIGPNASGKSNIINSFHFALQFIINTISRRENAEINTQSFLFDDVCRNQPSRFEFIFYKDEIKYVYGFSINRSEVLEEYLMGYFSAKPKTLFDRSANQKFEFKGNDEREQKEISQKTNKNRLYMPVAAEWGYEPLKKVYDWFLNITRQYTDFNLSNIVEAIIQNKHQKDIFITELKNADFNIVDIYIKNKKMTSVTHDAVDRFLKDLLGENKEFNIPDSTPSIILTHQNQDGVTFDIALEEDSAGTETIVENIAELLYLGEQGGIVIEDELGKTYHTKLTQYFLQMFKRNETNPGNTQLFFSSHDTKLLNLLSPEQIYLVDKESDGSTFIELLDNYTIREKDNIELGYLKGRYGGIPYMKE